MNPLLMYAERAIDYVKNTVRVRASNMPEGVNRPYVDGAVAATRQQAVNAFQQGSDHSFSANIKARSDAVKNTGFANCMGQSAVVFEYFRERNHTGVGFCGCQELNHVWVMTGLGANPGTQRCNVGQNPPAAFTHACVVDPWWHEWFMVTPDWNRKMPYILGKASNSYDVVNHATQGAVMTYKLAGGTQFDVRCYDYF